MINRHNEARRKKMLGDLSLKSLLGVEIGALCRPIVRQEDGDVIYVDHADTTALKNKYKNDANVDIDAIVDVGAVWGENTLHDAIGGKYVDYVVASHVIEHVPDLIGWLRELASVLRPTGEVRLAVPDMRFTFDRLRRETQLSDVLLSYLVKARVPQPHSMLDFTLGVIADDCAAVWSNSAEANPDKLYSIQDAVVLAEDIIKNGNYHDIHCWTFTPKSFAKLMSDIARTGLTDFACEGFNDTSPYQNEFFVRLRRSNDLSYILDSWQRMHRAAMGAGPGMLIWKARRALGGYTRAFAPGRISGRASELDAKHLLNVSSHFDANAYYEANPDVKAAGIDAAAHYQHHGWHEGRPLLPAEI